MAASEAEIRSALAWETGAKQPSDKNTWEWLWEAIQGDFNDNRSTGQIAFDAAVSMIPVVDQICDVRDIIANCKGIAQSKEGEDNTWKYVALSLTLIGLVPTLGSLLKGVLKIAFTFVRRLGFNQLEKAVDLSMTWIITFLRKREVQAYLKAHKVDHVFKWLAEGVRAVQKKVSTQELLKAFDKGISTLKKLLEKVTWLPKVGKRAQQTIDMVEKVRAAAPQPLKKVDDLLQQILSAIARRFEMEDLLLRHGIVDVRNIHFRGALPETTAVRLMKKKPRPAWLSDEGAARKLAPADPDQLRQKLQARVKDGWPPLTDQGIASFHKLAAVEIAGPAKLYRILAPNSRAMSDCWVTEEVFKRIQAAPKPREFWRKYLAVWPDWNVNGQFVVYELKVGESLKVWKGPASSQVKKDMPDAFLEGGEEQIVFNVARGDARNDTMRYYRQGGAEGTRLQRPIAQKEFDALSREQKAQYIGLREEINHPNISGPFETGWGYADDFASEAMPDRIGLPTLPGQTSQVR